MKIVVKGIVKQTSQWVDIIRGEMTNVSSFEDANIITRQLKEHIEDVYKLDDSGFASINDVVIDIQSFAVISVNVEE